MTSRTVISVGTAKVFQEIGPAPIIMIYTSSGSDVHRDSESEVRSSNFLKSNPQVRDSILRDACNVVTDSTMTAIYMPEFVSFCVVNNKALEIKSN